MNARIPSLLAAASAALALGVGAAVTMGFSPAGWPFVEGGADAQDEAQLLALRGQHNLLVMVADRAAPDQAVADVRVRISEAAQRPGYDRPMTGVWLLVNLPGGRYDVDLLHRGRLQRQPVLITPDDRQAMVFYVDAAEPAAD